VEYRWSHFLIRSKRITLAGHSSRKIRIQKQPGTQDKNLSQKKKKKKKERKEKKKRKGKLGG
jgi:hypothetical protein